MIFSKSGAHISGCRKYRYLLWRIWEEKLPHVLWIMLNPSTADESVNDATIRKCIKYAKYWGYGGIHVCNLFAYRSRDPGMMKKFSAPVGEMNNGIILEAARVAPVTVCAWGSHGSHLRRSITVQDMLAENYIKPHALHLTKGGEPGHPLFLKDNLTPQLISDLYMERFK